MLNNKASKTPLCAEFGFTTKQQNKIGWNGDWQEHSGYNEQLWLLAEGGLRAVRASRGNLSWISFFLNNKKE